MLAAGLVVAGCSSGSGTTSAGSTTAEGSTDAGGPIRLVDGTGAEVVLDHPATRVVALEWTYAEELVALGLDPVGVADPGGYAGWVSAAPLPEGTEDVGTRAEPSLERIRALRPDLIIAVGYRHEAIRAELEDRAPTLVFDPYPEGADHLEEMRTTFRTIARAVGRTDEAEAVLAELDGTVADAATRLQGAGLAGAPVAVAQGALQQGLPVVRLFTDNAMVSGLLAETGLTNAWAGTPEQFGYNTVELEALTRLPDDARLLTISQPVSDPFADAFPGNPAWDGLPMVQEGNVYPLGGDTWTFGGPRSAEVFVRRVVERMGA